MDDIETKNAIITHAALTSRGAGHLDAILTISYGDGDCQGFGPKDRSASSTGEFISRCMEIADVTDWSLIVGKTIRVKSDFVRIHAIGHIIKDDWFAPAVDFAAHQKYETLKGTKATSAAMTAEEVAVFEKSVFNSRKALGLSDYEANRGLTNTFTTKEQ